MMRLFLIVVLVLLYNTVHAMRFQTQESLLKSNQADSNKVNELLQLSFTLASQEPQRALESAEKALSISKSINWEKGIAKSYSRKGVVYYYLANYDSAFDYYYRALRIYENKKDWNAQSGVLNNLGLVFQTKFEYPKARSYYLEALELAERTKDTKRVAGIKMNIGIVYRREGKTDSAYLYYNASKKVFEDFNDLRSLSLVYNNIGLVLQEYGQYDSAVYYHKASLLYAKPMKNYNLVARNLLNMGKVKAAKQELDSAEYYYKNAFTITDTLKLKMAQLESLGQLKALEIKKNNFEQAMEYQNQEIEVQNYMFNQEKEEQIERLKVEYGIEKANRELLLSNKSNKAQKQLILLLILLSFVMLAFLFVLWRLIRNKIKVNTVLRELNNQVIERNSKISETSKELRLANKKVQEINENLEQMVQERTVVLQRQNEKLIEYAHFNAHEIRGPVARLSGLLNLKNNHPGSIQPLEFVNKACPAIEELQNKVDSISSVLSEEEWGVMENKRIKKAR